MTPRRIAVTAAFALLAGIYLFSTWRDLQRGPHLDEVEHLHTAARMARGDRIYVDFAQHHPPLFYGLLMPLVHEGDSIEAMRGYVNRARLLTAVASAAAIVAAALLVWRAAGDPWTVVIFVGIVFAAGGVWRNGLGDIRPDAAALALLWIGAALVLLTRKAALRGVGVGLVFVAGLIVPKWPLMSVAIAVLLLVEIGRDWRALLIASGTALVTAAAGLGATALLSDLRLAFFHAVELTWMMVVPEAERTFELFPSFFACPLLLRPWPILLAALLIAAWRPPRRLVLYLFVLTAAAFCEIRFFYPYPAVEHRFYANWVLAASPILALAPRSAAALLEATRPSLRRVGAAIVAVSLVLALLASTDVIAPPRPQPDSYWRSTAWLLARMRPGDTVWLERPKHPIGIPDAAYSWYGMRDVIVTSLRARETPEGRRFLPPISDAGLPPCRIEQGLAPNVRFLSEPIPHLPRSRECFRRLVQRRAVVRTPFLDVWMVPLP